MKIIKYLFKPIKYIVLLSIFCSLIYFRSIIFQPGINKYINVAVSYIGDSINIEIPAYTAIIESDEHEDLASNDKISVSPSIDANIKTHQDGKNHISAEASKVSLNNQSLPEKSEQVANNQDDQKTGALEKLTDAVNLINNKVDRLFKKNASSSGRQSVSLNNETSPAKSPLVLNASEVENTGDSASVGGSTYDIRRELLIARRSFWNGNVLLSEQSYLEIAKHDNANPDIYGELGNVYYAQGKWKQAGEAYYEAAIRLLDLKQDGQIKYLLRVIQGLDADSAEKLRQKYRSFNS
jgi:hypothetical protein